MKGLSENELKALEQEIRSLKDKIETIVDRIYQYSDHQEYQMDFEHEDEDTLKWALQSIYRCIVLYFEGRGLRSFAKDFRKAFKSTIDDSAKLTNYNVHEDFAYSPVLSDMNLFLRPFSQFSALNKDDLETKQVRLKNILESTPQIILRTKTQVTNEASVYREVRWVINLFYPSARETGVPKFIGHFKTYKPDIVIPELETIIEYKFVKNGKDIDSYFDELIVDATNYQGDLDYKHYFAVLCLNRDSTPGETIRSAWRSKNFPKAWTLVLANL